MNILLIGSGAREHTLAYIFRQSPLCGQLYAAPGNPGIGELAELWTYSSSDELLQLAKEKSIDLAVIGPEQPLVEGLADVLRGAGIAVFGPGREGAALEGSKAFSKEFMESMEIPTARAAIAHSLDEARELAAAWEELPVLKADGLAAGKGVFLPECREELEAVLLDLYARDSLGEAGKKLLLEERLVGPEISLFALRSESGYCYLGCARDHKRAYENDEGPNTGGMGTISPAEEMSTEEKEQAKDILEKTHRGLLEKNIPFRGVLFVGAMRTKDGLKVLEYNVRFGDPETQSLLPRIEDDMLELISKTAQGEPLPETVSYKEPAGVCVCLVSEGYPISSSEPARVSFGEREEGVLLLHAGTKEIDGQLYASGGRVFSLVAFGTDVAKARGRVYKNINAVHFPGMWYRKDI